MAELEQLAHTSVDQSIASAAESMDLPDGLFPLPLTPFEHFLIIDDSVSHPMTAFVQLTFRDSIDLPRLESALEQALRRNPLLASRIVPFKQSWAWSHDSTWRVVVRSMAIASPCIHGMIPPLDLRHEPGMRVWQEIAADGSRLVFQFHHACADGIGMRRFLVDTMVCYARSYSHSSDPVHAPIRLDRLDHQRLRHRGNLQHLTDTPPIRKLTSWERTKNFIYFFFRPPVPLLGSPIDPKLDVSGGQGSHSAEEAIDEPTVIWRLDADQSKAIVERARSEEVNLNDLGLALLFHVCRQWHEQQRSRGSGKRIRILMPFDIRTKEDLRLSAANRMSFSFLGRTHRQCDDWSELLRSVQTETRDIKDTRVYLDFLLGLRDGMAVPGLLRWIVRRCRNMATVVFTYAGDVHRGLNRSFVEEDGYTRVGDALFQDVLAAPPVRTNTNLALGLCLGKGRICISAAWNRQVMTASDTRRFLQMFAEAWCNWARTGQP